MRVSLGAVAAVLMLIAAVPARAAESIYFENAPLQNLLAVVEAESGTASPLNTVGAGIDAPEGLSYDPVANRLYVAVEGLSADGHIAFVNLDGSGGGSLPLPPLLPAVKDPRGVAVDPVGRTAYWLNNTDSTPESIHYAPLVGSGGTAGELEAKANGGGANFFGIAVDPASSRLFWVEFGINAVWVAGLSGAAKSEVVQGVSAAIDQPTGLAFDPDRDRLYWANSGKEEAKATIGFANLGSQAGEITPTGVPVDLPQDVLVIKSPSGLGLPAISVAANGVLTCSQGTWRGDYVSSFLYQSPRSFGYQWTLNDAPIPAATATTLTPSVSGRYKCVVTATNQAGSTSRTSLGVQATVTRTTTTGKKTTRPAQANPKPAILQILGKARHLKARPGKLLALKVRTVNQGDAASTPVKLCLKLTRGAKRALRASKCQRLGALGGDAADTAKLRLRVKGSADPGLYKLRISLPGDQVKVTVRVLG